MLVISPPRELAAQIAEEAKQITAFQQNFRVQVRLCVPLCSPQSALCMQEACASLCAKDRCLSVGDGEHVSRLSVSICSISSKQSDTLVAPLMLLCHRELPTAWQAHDVQT